MRTKTTCLEPGQPSGTSNLAWGGTMFRTGRFSAPGLAGLLVAALAAAGCSSQPGPAVSVAPGATASSSSAAPVVLTGVSLLTDGDAPRLLLSAEGGSLQPMVYTREGSKTLVVDLPGAVVRPGLEPPRADGAVLSQLGMRSFTELGQPLVRFELTGRRALDAKVSGDPGSHAMSVALLSRPEEPAVAVAPVPPPSAAVVAESRPEPTPVEPAAVSAPVAASTPVVVAQHSATGRPATRLSRVDARRKDGSLSVKLEGDGELSYEAFTLADPPRFVLDLTGVRNASGFKTQNVSGADVARVRVSQFRTEPTAVTRVVFDLAGESLPVVRQSGAGVVVSFGSAPAAAPSAPVAVASAPAPKPPVAAAAAVPVAGSYEAHEADDSREPVVAVPAAVAKAEPTPAPAEPPVAVAEAAPIVVPEEPARAVPAPVPAAPAPPVVTVAAAPAPAPAPAVPAPPAAAAPRVASVEATTTPTVAMASPEVAAPVSAPAPKPARKKVSADDRALLEAAETLAAQQESQGQPKDISNPFESRSIGQTDRQYTGEPLTLNLKDADIKDTLQKFSELTNLNIVLDPDVRGTVTVSLTDIPWDQALELILKINGLGYVLEGNVMRIASTSKLA